MNKEETKAAIAVMQAYVDGAEIEWMHNCCLPRDGDWYPGSPRHMLSWSWGSCSYRVKPKPKFVFKPEVGFKFKGSNGRNYVIASVDKDSVLCVEQIAIGVVDNRFPLMLTLQGKNYYTTYGSVSAEDFAD